MANIKQKLEAISLMSVISLILPAFSFGKTFNPNNIISDYDLTNYNSMSVGAIQEFLDKKGYLGQMTFENFFGEKSTTAELIYKYANQFKINPQYLIVTLQKEQSLIEKPLEKITQRDLDWATGFGVCDNCSKDDPAIQIYKGFDNQVYHAARRNRDYINNPTVFNYQVGKTSKIDEIYVTPENQATANLYIYTPHIHGNENFFNLWTKYFSEKLPEYTLATTDENNTIWLIKDNIKYPFYTHSAVNTRFNADNIIKVSKYELEKYQLGQAISHDNYSLFRDITSGDYYLLDDNKLRKLYSEKALKTANINTKSVTLVNINSLKYEFGEDITEKTKYATGALVEDLDFGGYWFVKDNKKHFIATNELLKLKYPNTKATKIPHNTLVSFAISGDDTLKTGTLISDSNNTIYIIANSERIEITPEKLEKLGYNKKNIIKVSDETLLLHPKAFLLAK